MVTIIIWMLFGLAMWACVGAFAYILVPYDKYFKDRKVLGNLFYWFCKPGIWLVTALWILIIILGGGEGK